MRIGEVSTEFWNLDRQVLAELCTIICETSEAAVIIQNLLKTFSSTDDFSHIKRARKCDGGVQIIIGTSQFVDSHRAELAKVLGRDIDNLNIVLIKVPKYPPRTSSEARIMTNTHWPTTFRRGRDYWCPQDPPDRLRVIEIAQSLSNAYADICHSGAQSFDCSPFCAIYKNGEQIASGQMRCECASLLKHGPLEAIDDLGDKIVALNQAQSTNKCSRATQNSPHIHTNDDDTLQALTADQYYATDCDAYVINEPCVMCVMGLLHSRISRLFVLACREKFLSGAHKVLTTLDVDAEGCPGEAISESQSTVSTTSCAQTRSAQFWESPNGGLGGSGINILACPLLNHHYRVYVCTLC